MRENIDTHYKFSDEEFVKQFSNCSLKPEIFNHEAHLRLAWININSLGLKDAEEKIQSQLQNFVAFVGVKDKYNTTVTVVAMKVVHHFMKKSKSNNFKDFIVENPQLKKNFKGLIDSHYSFDIFKSTKAKFEFIEPDLLPFT